VCEASTLDQTCKTAKSGIRVPETETQVRVQAVSGS
jgi:hypothetical protein